MRNGGIDANDILSSLRSCSVVSVELHGLEWRWAASGRDCDGKQIEIVVVADEVAERIEVQY